MNDRNSGVDQSTLQQFVFRASSTTLFDAFCDVEVTVSEISRDASALDFLAEMLDFGNFRLLMRWIEEYRAVGATPRFPVRYDRFI